MSALDALLGPAALPELLPAPPRPEGWPPELRTHLSQSSISLFMRCPEQARRVYFKGERRRPGAAMVWGSADHYAHEQNFVQKIESHRDIGEGDVKLAFAEGFDRSVDSNGGEDEVDWGEDQPGDLKDRGVKLVACYHKQVSPRIQPTAVEKNLTLELPGVPVPVVGRLDIETETYLVEGKTAGRREKEPKLEWRLQGALYQLATGLPVEYHVKAKTKVPAVYTPQEEPGLRFVASQMLLDSTVERVRRIVATILYYYATYGPDEPWPTAAPDYGWACGYCGFRPDCVWWKDDPVPLAAVPGFGERPSGIPAEQIAFGDSESEQVKLERLVLAYARERGIEMEAREKIGASRAADPEAHTVWLKEQIGLAEKAATTE